jgi:para-nitrobenzyl esterase
MIAGELNVEPTRRAFSAIPPDELVAAQTRVMARNPILDGVTGYTAEPDPETMPEDPWAAFKAGAAARIPVVAGWTAEEYRLWLAPSRGTLRVGRLHLLLAMLRFRIRPRTIRAYRRHGCSTPAEILGMLVTDRLVRVAVHRLAELRRTQGARTFVYEFAWRSPVEGLGAAHAVDVAFAFDNLDTDEARMISGTAPPQALADRMHAAWVRFAKTGDPGWPVWDETRPVMVFADPGAGVQRSPRDDVRADVDAAMPAW